MSLIPEPEVVARGGLPSVGEILAFANEMIVRHSTDDHKIVLYGSLVRGDATIRSDIDLCVVPPSQAMPYWSNPYPHGARDEIEAEIKRQGWSTSLTLLNCVSRREDVKHLDPFLAETSDPDEAMFSITTFDHFGFLARDTRFPEETRRLYAQIQRDVRKHSRTGKEERLRDLARYIHSSWEHANFYLRPSSQGYWGTLRRQCPSKATAGWAENAAYHCLRKLAGITKTLKGSDAKAMLADCFDLRVPFFAELLQHFSVVRRFGLDIEKVIGRCLGRPELVDDYEAFLDARMIPMTESTMAILDLLDREIEERTLLETIADYDRQASKTVLLADRFGLLFDQVREWLREEGVEVCLAVHWWCMGERVFVDSPSRAFVEYKGKTEPLWQQPYFNHKRLDPRRITAEGRVEIDFTKLPPELRSVSARPMKSGRDDYQQAAELAEKAVIVKLREVLPTEIIFLPQSK